MNEKEIFFKYSLLNIKFITKILGLTEKWRLHALSKILSHQVRLRASKRNHTV